MQFNPRDHVFLIQSARAGHEAAMEALLREYDDLIVAIARRYAGSTAYRQQNLPDLLQDARLAFVRAVHGFNLSRHDSTLRSYAGRSMENECKDQSRYYLYPYTVPQRTNDLRMKLRRIERDLQEQLGREPMALEIARVAGIAPQELGHATRMPGLVLLNQPIGTTGGLDGEAIYPQIAVSDDAAIDTLLWRALLQPCVSLLEPDQQVIITQAVMEERSQREIAAELGLSELTVSRIKFRALKELRQMIAGEGVLR